MKKIGTRMGAMAIALVLALCIVAQGALADTFQAHEVTRDIWTQETDAFTWDESVHSLKDHHTGVSYGRQSSTIDAIINSELGDGYIKNMYYFINGYDEMDEEVLQFWLDNGIKKEMHDADINEGANAWASYTPLSAYEEENADKTYPVLFVYHGNNNPIFITETYGFAQLVADEEFICVMPWANNSEEGVDGAAAADTDHILEVLRENYPIDESRIYGTGFSQGGRIVVFEALRVPGRFAAINPGGMHLAGVKIIEDFIPDEWWDAEKETAIIQMAGTMESNLKYPYGIQGDIQVNAINKWFALNHVEVEPVSVNGALGLAATSKNPVEAAIGLKFHDDYYTTEYDGTPYYFGNYYNVDGVNIMRHVAIEGGIHWPTGSFAKVAWDYMSQFARDLETGELIVLE